MYTLGEQQIGSVMRSNEREGSGDGWRDYTDLKRMLRALGDSVRLNILRALASDDEVKVTDLAERLMVSQPLVSWHLTILRRMEFVRTRRQGREVYCSLDAARCVTGWSISNSTRLGRGRTTRVHNRERYCRGRN